MESLLQATVEEMKEDFHKRMAAFEDELQKSTSSSPGIATLAAEFTTYRTFITKTLMLLQQQIEALSQSVDNIEMHRRRKILLFHGVAEVQDETTEQVVMDVVVQKIGLSNFKVEDISRCHRMGRPTSGKKPRPILVKLLNTDTRNSIWFNKTKLKGSGVTLSEFLTKSRHDIFMAARDMFGINKSWTKDGNIFVFSGGARHRVVSINQLSQIPVDSIKPAPATKPATSVKTRRGATSKK